MNLSNPNPIKQSFKSRVNASSLPFKIAIIAVIVLLLLIPKFMVLDLIRERKTRNDNVQREVEVKWGSPQTICAPYIIIPYDIVNGDIVNSSTITILPENLDIQSEITPEKGKKRGIYEVDLYRSNHNVKGFFKLPDVKSITNASNIYWDQAKVVVNISDLVGVEEKIQLSLNDESYETSSGSVNNNIFSTGVHCIFDIDKASRELPIYFDFDLKLKGSRSLQYIPLGKVSNFSISSAEGAPKFNGQFLPNIQKTNKTGFNASWKILDINRNFPQYWIGTKSSVSRSAFGVDLFPGIDEYVKNERSIKYAILFLSLTFLIFFLYEVIKGLKIHPIQYGLVGLALILFFVLLIALSEHISFAYAYMIATTSILSSIGIFIHSIFKNKKSTLSIVGLIGVIYGFIYVVLQLEDYALLAGAIGLFIVLFIVMLVARKINWYQD